MNELIKVTQNESVEFVEKYSSERNKTFEVLFLKVRKDVVENMDNVTKLRKIRSALKFNKFLYNFDHELIVYLKDSIECEIALCSIKKERVNKEKKYKEKIVKNFNAYFPEYEFVSQEVCVKNIGRIDILATDKKSDRPVLIELKKERFNPTKQLLAYATEFKSPILIGITEKNISNKHKNIRYLTYNQLMKEDRK